MVNLPLCLYCNKPCKRKDRKYCSNKCQMLYQADKKVESGKSVYPLSYKRYLIRQNGNICSICKLKEWLGKPIPLVLDHIDGNPNNNALSNFRLVCGNCDMQLPTYKAKNTGHGRYSRRLRYSQGKSY
jgi:hypothetical protein